jgi:hypothetical protein
MKRKKAKNTWQKDIFRYTQKKCIYLYYIFLRNVVEKNVIKSIFLLFLRRKSREREKK